MIFEHAIELCGQAHIGKNGLPDFSKLPELAVAEHSLEKLREAHKNGSLPLLQLPFQTSDLQSIAKIAQEIRTAASDIVFLGTGGSSLGGQALAQLAGWHVAGMEGFNSLPRLHFFDNLDPQSFESLLKNIPLETARFVIISKSGNTAETLVQTLLVLDCLQKAGRKIANHVVGLTEPENWKTNALRKLLSNFNVTILDHDTRIGGRYSALTNVGLLPAAIMGLDIATIRAGACEIMEPIVQGASAQATPSALGAALMAAFAARGINETVMMAYADRLERFTAWYVQLWAESLGKNGKGTTPIRALGPVDQHSQLQLFLDGPSNKVFTIITIDSKNLGPRIDENFAHRAGLGEFAGKTIGDLIAAQGQATAETLAKRMRPVRLMRFKKLDERALGALMMHFFLETIITADILQVDAFDQPAVEEGKVLAKAYLRQES
jgi:glucose-6-phosphate isomerase